ncbi:hypothetical protein D0469_16900 [Peribacillus saganii]|uniref:Uncharacterized protein n=1 Tax=Peribacillus saganii TaxID=2303992 RepID=A0A372LK37_9BACI|nr:hypothetical protein [Peribacillus saganii]RFU66795.1 hypothetical protein D0469_16900 [Peribacillus saganii]
MRMLWRLIVIVGASAAAIRYRYRLMNMVLGNSMLRKFVVSRSLNVPLLRDKMMQSMFRP